MTSFTTSRRFFGSKADILTQKHPYNTLFENVIREKSGYYPDRIVIQAIKTQVCITPFRGGDIQLPI